MAFAPTSSSKACTEAAADERPTEMGLTAPAYRRSVDCTYRKEGWDAGDRQLREAQGAGRKGG